MLPRLNPNPAASARLELLRFPHPGRSQRGEIARTARLAVFVARVNPFRGFRLYLWRRRKSHVIPDEE
jgi:hypothetical protein